MLMGYLRSAITRITLEFMLDGDTLDILPAQLLAFGHMVGVKVTQPAATHIKLPQVASVPVVVHFLSIGTFYWA